MAKDDSASSASEMTEIVKSSYATAVRGAQDYNNKLIEFAQANTNAAFEFFQNLAAVKSPSEFLELSAQHARKQVETMTDQTRQLAELARKVTAASAHPLKQTGKADKS
jgi:phasin